MEAQLLIPLAELRSRETQFLDLSCRISKIQDNITFFKAHRSAILHKPGVLKPEFAHLADLDDSKEVPLEESYFAKTLYFKDVQRYSTSVDTSKLEHAQSSFSSLSTEIDELVNSCIVFVNKMLENIEGESVAAEILHDLKQFKESHDFSRLGVIESKVKLLPKTEMPRNLSPRLESKMSSDSGLGEPKSPLNQQETMDDLLISFAELQSREKEYLDLAQKITKIKNNIDFFSKQRRSILEKDGVLKPEFKNKVLEAAEEVALDESMFLKPVYLRDAKRYSTADSEKSLVENQSKLASLSAKVAEYISTCVSDLELLSKSSKLKVPAVGIVKDLNEFKESLDFSRLKVIEAKLRILREK